ncbi:MAG: hypothetical protein BV457_02105 [Thermoplasmata archaeon M9B1D]|nr:MAG: hypothetical protein BV457_02105 [Thermoplasmata archaeon M9B1D]
MDKRILQISNLLTVVLTIVVNSLANILPINGKNTGQLSDNIPNLFVPSGITFAIWGVIYLLLILFAIYQARDFFKKEKIEMPYLTKITPLFILSSAANIIWIFLWHYEQVALSLIAMLILLISLIAIYIKLNVSQQQIPLKEKMFLHVPFSVYLGWITVATIANITAWLVTISWDGFGISDVTWTIIVLCVATLLTLIILYKRKDIAYSLVIIWALLGIVIKRIQDQKEIATTAIIAIILIIITIISIIIFKYYKK